MGLFCLYYLAFRVHTYIHTYIHTEREREIAVSELFLSISAIGSIPPVKSVCTMWRAHVLPAIRCSWSHVIPPTIMLGTQYSFESVGGSSTSVFRDSICAEALYTFNAPPLPFSKPSIIGQQSLTRLKYSTRFLALTWD